MDTPFLTPSGLLFLLCTSDRQQKSHQLCRGPFNEHSNKAYFHLDQWFQRRLKCKRLLMPTTTDYNYGRQVISPPPPPEKRKVFRAKS